MSEETPWLSPSQLHNWLVLSAALTVLPDAVDGQLKRDSGLNYFEYTVLGALSSAPRRAMKMSLLASFSNGSPSRLSHAIKRLERAGWVQRRSGPHSSRAVEAVLTDTGYAKVVEAAPRHVVEVRRLVVDVLSAEEFDQLNRTLRKIVMVAQPETMGLIDRTFADQVRAAGGEPSEAGSDVLPAD